MQPIMQRAQNSSPFIIESFYMFEISIWFDKDGDPDATGIKCNNCDKVTAYKLKNE